MRTMILMMVVSWFLALAMWVLSTQRGEAHEPRIEAVELTADAHCIEIRTY